MNAEQKTNFTIDDSIKPKSQLIEELQQLRKQVAAFCACEEKREQVENQLKKAFHALHLQQEHLRIQKEQLLIAKQELEASHEQHIELFDFAPIGYFIFNQYGVIKKVNLTGAEMLRYQRKSITGKPMQRYVSKPSQDAFLSHLHRIFRKSNTCFRTELELLRKDGRPFPAELESVPIKNNLGKVLYCRTVIKDITESKLSEEKINRSYYIKSLISSILQISLEPISLQEQLKRILDLILSIPWLSLQSKGCIYLVEEDPRMLIMKVQRGLSESFQTCCDKVPFRKCLCGMSASTKEILFADQNYDCQEAHYQSLLPCGHYCVPILSGKRVLGVINLYIEGEHKKNQEEMELLSAIANTVAGIIERKKIEQEKDRLQAQLIHHEKLSALGRLTANVAHEIRNPLTVLGGFARKLNKKISAAIEEKEYVEIIISEVNRLEKILKNVLMFSKDMHVLIEQHNINEIVNDSLKTFRSACAKQSIDIQKSFKMVPQIQVDGKRVKQAVDNILSNAIDSMPKGGTLSVGTHEQFKSGITYVVVTIKDEGEGIEKDKLSKIFEPFFTTKAVGHFYGTGHGLSISKKIMEAHHGFINADSIIGRGSTFSLYFPYKSKEKLSKVPCR